MAAEAETTPPPPTATAAATDQSVVLAASGAIPTEMTEDLTYHSGGEPFSTKSGVIDVIAPTGGGPWPTVVVFHGDPRSAGKGWHRPDAQMIAEQGRVVFLPAWGHVDSAATQDMGVEAAWDLMVRELKCAVVFAHSHAEEFGGDPDHIALYGLSAGGNAVLMAGLADAQPLDACSVPGPAISVQALVPIDADWVLGGGWDAELTDNPEAFYSITPWRFLDGSQDIPIHVMVTEITGPLTRSVEPDPATSWLSYRHSDIDLVADLDARGFLADGDFSLKESGEHAFEILKEAGYEASLVEMPGAEHASWGEEGTAVVVNTVLNAEG
jgi:acetyl esterase/lipase